MYFSYIVRLFLQKELGWSVRSPTTAAQKLPDDYRAKFLMIIYRLSFLMKTYSIHDRLVINFDQTGVTLIPYGFEKTYDETGKKDIATIRRR